jgi:hypothetical protein
MIELVGAVYVDHRNVTLDAITLLTEVCGLVTVALLLHDCTALYTSHLVYASHSCSGFCLLMLKCD